MLKLANDWVAPIVTLAFGRSALSKSDWLAWIRVTAEPSTSAARLRPKRAFWNLPDANRPTARPTGAVIGWRRRWGAVRPRTAECGVDVRHNTPTVRAASYGRIRS